LAPALPSAIPGLAAALVLQRSLAPALPSAIPGLDVGARYVPAEGDLGGDWYDLFELPGGRLGFVMGDVVGHGLHAAVVMGRLKSALRAYALITPEPTDVLSMLDHKISRFEPGITATVIYGVTPEPYDHVEFSSAGHWPPLLSHQGKATVIDVVPNLPLGVHTNASRSTFHVHLQPGDAVCLYTDGLLELGRQESPDKALNNLMREMASLDPSESADLNCSRIIANLLGGHTNDDDIALLLIRRTNTQQ
jgi:serine phosphatase RsbU (regulator of sigma subunit)